MRPIDADALMKDQYNIDDFGTVYGKRAYVTFDEIEEAPTIEPERKKGKWIIEEMNTYELSYGTTAYEPVYRCSVCGCLTESYLRLDEPIMPEDADFPRFCPWCGADMREGKQDETD